MPGETFVKVTAVLSSPLCGEAPQLDGILELAIAPFHPAGVALHRVDRNFPAPPAGAVPIPIPRRMVAGWPVARCSSPILGVPSTTTVEHVAKRIEPENAPLLAPGKARKIVTSNTWTKSYRLPMHVRRVDRVVWFAVGKASRIRQLLAKGVPAVGKKRSVGYGAVAEWIVEPWDEDWSWFAPSDHGRVLMRPLPIGDHLPEGLIGFRADFGACVPPYWHPERYGEIVTPC